MTITLQFEPKQLWDIYKENPNYRYSTPFRHFFTAVVLLAISLLAINYFDLVNDLVVLPAIGFLIYFIVLVSQIQSVWQNRRKLKKYLKEIAQYSSYSLGIYEDMILLKMDGEEHPFYWQKIETATITDKYLTLNHPEGLIIPKASMSSEDFGRATRRINQRLKEKLA